MRSCHPVKRLAKFTVVRRDYCVNDEEHNHKMEFGSRMRFTPRHPLPQTVQMTESAAWPLLELNQGVFLCSWRKRNSDHKQGMSFRMAAVSSCQFRYSGSLFFFVVFKAYSSTRKSLWVSLMRAPVKTIGFSFDVWRSCLLTTISKLH